MTTNQHVTRVLIVGIEQGRPTFFSRGPNFLFQKFGEPKFIVYCFFCQKVGEDQKKKSRSDLISVFCQKVGEDQKKKKNKTGLRSDLISVFCQKVGDDQKKQKKRSSLKFDRCFKKRTLWYFSATHNVSAEASINQPTQKSSVGHVKTFGGPLLARGRRVGRS